MGSRHVIYFTTQADLVEEGERLTRINGTDLIAAANQFLGKFAIALAGGLSGTVLSQGNYVAGKL